MRGEFPSTDYQEVAISSRIEFLGVKLYEKPIQVGIGLPLYDLSVSALAYEKHKQRKLNKLGSRLAAGTVSLKQVHTMTSSNSAFVNLQGH